MSFLKDIYEGQKKIIKELQDSLEGPAKELVGKLYDGQKEIIKKAQDEAIVLVKNQYNTSMGALYDRIVDVIRKRGFIGRLVAKFLSSCKYEILNKLLFK